MTDIVLAPLVANVLSAAQHGKHLVGRAGALGVKLTGEALFVEEPVTISHVNRLRSAA